MRFDPRDRVFRADGRLDAYDHHLFKDLLALAFERSPEAHRAGDGIRLTYCDALIHCLHEHHGRALVDLDASELRRLTLESLPRWVWLDSSAAPGLITTWRALFEWLARAHRLPHAAECAAWLAEPELEARLAAAIDDSAHASVRPTMWIVHDPEGDLRDDLDDVTPVVRDAS